jgi:hypothetical protein
MEQQIVKESDWDYGEGSYYCGLNKESGEIWTGIPGKSKEQQLKAIKKRAKLFQTESILFIRSNK